MEIQKALPLYQQAYRLIRAKILAGELEPGQSLLESHAAQMLNISRTPVREALRQLEREGLVVGNASDRVVASPTEEEFLNLYTCRGALERIVAERASLLATEEDFQAMSGSIEEAEARAEEGDHDGVLTANTHFHDRMVQGARMPQLSALMDTIRGQILLARRYVLSDSTAAEKAICEEHRALLAALRNRKAERAKTLMQAHMQGDIERGTQRFCE